MIYKLVAFVIFIFLSAFNFNNTKPHFSKWVITNGCFLKVGGSTNINRFSCIIPNYSKPDTLTFYKNNAVEVVRATGSIKLDVQNFDCHNPVMTKDLRKTLKSKEHPNLIIRFTSFSRYPRFNNQPDKIKGFVNIELAGVSKKFEVDYQFVSDGAKFLNLIGTKQVLFSDFNLIPPRKIGGMIQTNNELSVVFNLRVKVIT